IGRQRLDQERRAVDEADGVGERDRHEGRRRAVLGVRTAGEGRRAHAGLKIRPAFADRLDHARRLHAGDIGELRLDGIRALPEARVGEVHADRVVLDHHAARTDLRLGNIGLGQHFGTTGLREDDRFHPCLLGARHTLSQNGGVPRRRNWAPDISYGISSSCGNSMASTRASYIRVPDWSVSGRYAFAVAAALAAGAIRGALTPLWGEDL